MAEERAVNLSIENGVLVVECVKELRITIPKVEGAVYVDNISDNKVAITGNPWIIEYYLDMVPKYRFIGEFKQPQSAKNVNGMFNINISEGEGCLITLPNSKDNIFIYNESGLLCFRGSSKIIDKNKTTAFKVK